MSKKGPAKKKGSTKKSNLYKLDGEKLVRSRNICPRCGPGVFMADHGDRLACGKCGYTEWKQKN